mmetsp:Transcript_67332/g.108449  ORF Transcript_67332/g.108449 Transcript_67332/m.108449 type:complete len:234 (-) Transcript_67332:970-1671(-)
MILRRTCGACEVASIGGAVDGGSEYLIHKVRIVADHSSREVSFHTLAALQNLLEVFVTVANDDLEWAEELFGPGSKMLLLDCLLDRHFHGCGLESAIAGWHLCGFRFCLSQRTPTKSEASPWDCQDVVNVRQDLFVRPREHWAAGQVAKRAACSQILDLLHKAHLCPVLVNEHDRLCTALLPGEGVRILVALPRDIVHELWISIWPNDLPVEASIFKFHTALQVDHQVLSHGL